EYEQARSHYQKALDIYIEFNDRYWQASTYHQLGRVAEELREYEQARSHFLKALEIYIEFNEQHNRAIVLRSLARLHQATQDDTLLTDIAQHLNLTVEEAAQQIETLVE
ncbi:MAG: tetratricopeptide repeat protein, partial [Phormidesmis sp.]